MRNASKLKKMHPAEYARQIENYNMISTIAFHKMNGAIQPENYETLNPQNQVLAHGIFFKNLMAKYLAYLNINFNDPWLQTGARYANSPMLSAEEYEKLPKIYRSIFVPYDATHYILHTHRDTVLTVSAEHKQQLKILLEHARILIPVIYKTEHRDNALELSESEINQKWLTRTLGDAMTKVAFVPNSRSAKRVSDQQIDAIEKLRTIFREIDNISIMWSEHRDVKPSATYLYGTYQNELTRSNRYLRAQNEIKSVRSGIKELAAHAPESERAGIMALYENAEPQYNTIRQKVISGIKAGIQKNRVR